MTPGFDGRRFHAGAKSVIGEKKVGFPFRINTIPYSRQLFT